MTLIDGILNMVFRGRSVVPEAPPIDLSATQAKGLARKVRLTPPGAPLPEGLDVEDLLDRIDERLDAQTDRTREVVAPIVDEAVGRLGSVSARQAEALTQIQHQVDDSMEAVRRTAASHESLTAGIREVLTAVSRTQEDLRGQARAQDDRHTSLERTIAALQRRQWILTVACAAAALTALALALVALL